MILGVSILMGSWWMAAMVTSLSGIESIGPIMITALFGFVAGMIFVSGPKVKEVHTTKTLVPGGCER